MDNRIHSSESVNSKQTPLSYVALEMSIIYEFIHLKQTLVSIQVLMLNV